MVSLLLLAAVLPSLVAAAPTIAARHGGQPVDCWDFYSDIYAETKTNLDLTPILGYPPNEQAFIQGSLNLFAIDSQAFAAIGQANTTSVNGTYSLWFHYCQPRNQAPVGVFQAHHGFIASAGYWDIQLTNDNSLSFADAAAKAGWATLTYDRLGTGRSAHPDGTQVVQLSYEIEQSNAIAQALRSGKLGNGLPTFSKVVGLGHSYGSALLAGVTSQHPDAFDQAVLTGFTGNTSSGAGVTGLPGWSTQISSYAYPDRFAGHANDYVISPTQSNDQFGFFHYPNFTTAALDEFTASKGEFTLGQEASLFALGAFITGNYTKPTFVIAGERDASFCAANCYVTSLNGTGATQLDTLRPLFQGVDPKNFVTAIVNDTGHGINFHTTAPVAYKQILDFVSSH